MQIVEGEFLNYVTKLKYSVVHFFHKDFQRCKIMDQHLKILCQQFPQTQFLALNAEKTPFFVQKLAIRSLPTLCFFIDGVMKDKLLGF
jgi:thioredoxin-like negative regulator of GroEL